MSIDVSKIWCDAYDFEKEVIVQDLDVFRLVHERVRKNVFEQEDNGYWIVNFDVKIEETKLDRKFSNMPFIPACENERQKRLSDIFRIQASGLKKRLAHTGCGHAIIGISGGLDSTLALLVCAKTCDKLGIEHIAAELKADFKKFVIDNFIDEYIKGNTPNPCIVCNKYIKFGKMLEIAKKLKL